MNGKRSRTTSKREPESHDAAESSLGTSSFHETAPDISTKNILRDCLYFTANALARTISRLADVEFRSTGLAPSHAFLLMLVIESPGVAQKELSRSLQLAPSTVTRMVDALAAKKLVTRAISGRTTMVSPTQKGKKLLPTIHEAWWSLRRSYCEKLGEVEGDELARRIDEARAELED